MMEQGKSVIEGTFRHPEENVEFHQQIMLESARREVFGTTSMRGMCRSRADISGGRVDFQWRCVPAPRRA